MTIAMLWAAGCAELTEPSADPNLWVDGEALQRVSVPLFGGVVAADGDRVAAADVDGDRIELVDSDHARRWVHLPAGWVPGPLTFGDDGVLHVLARGAGRLVDIEPGWGASRPTLIADTAVCDAPRGLAVDPRDGRIWVACADGQLVGRLGDDELRFQLDSDLRDIVPFDDGRALISRFRTAEILRVDLDSGTVEARYVPPVPDGVFGGALGFESRVARRLIRHEDGALLLHQLHSLAEVNEQSLSYARMVGSVVTGVDLEGAFSPVEGESLPLAMDATVTSAGVLTIGEGFGTGAMVWGAADGAIWRTEAQLTGVAGSGDRVWVVTRGPYQLDQVASGGEDDAVPQGGGLELFQRAPRGIACASCHPDGADDGHVWTVEGVGPRRTMALGGGLLDSAPFHWDGAFADLGELYAAIGQGRMGQPPPWGDQLEQLAAWLDALPAAPAGPQPDQALVAEGRTLFHDPAVGCATCHVPPRYTSAEAYDVGTGGSLQVPSLLSVGARLPVLHDGCAQTLLQRFTDPDCGGGDEHGTTSTLAPEELEALAAFLATL